jgi:hypothetical protein
METLMPITASPLTVTLLREREEWRTRKDQFFVLRQNAFREEDDDNLVWFTHEYELALTRYRAVCDALDLLN